jgi:hypothetical protein
MSNDELKEYFKLIKSQTGMDVRIDWSVINPNQIAAYTSGRRMGLQIADAAASRYFYAVQPSSYGFTEDRYARMLKTVSFHRKGVFSGYGVKFWPREIDQFIETKENFRWFREVYK